MSDDAPRTLGPNAPSDPPAPGTDDRPPRATDRARTALLRWFARHARDLPWRERRDPYRVWVAETMLQQTRVATVVPYYHRWMTALPDLASLADAPEERVLRLWEGLGYYRRARALRRAAIEIVHQRNGRLPNDEAAWRELPGVGPYTAAALMAFGFGRRTVAVDANVRRVGARLTADAVPRDEHVRRALDPLLPNRRPERGTEALIELGATVCTPRAPRCDACPLATICLAHRLGDPEAFPARTARTAPPQRVRWAGLWRDGERLWLARRPSDGLLGGMWGPPQLDRPPPGRALPPVRHAYSHFTLLLTPVVVEPGTDPPPP
ncbi:MAG: A/G-specific adenine glycosylase, partial [Trueperaceae bacterium]